MGKLDKLLTCGEVARILGCSRQAVLNWQSTGKIPGMKTVTGVRIFRLRDVEAFSKNLVKKGRGWHRSKRDHTVISELIRVR